jgi:hypothetical protein
LAFNLIGRVSEMSQSRRRKIAKAGRMPTPEYASYEFL